MASGQPASGRASLAAAVLCGGQSRRMGRDKAMLPLVEGQLPKPIAEAAAHFRTGPIPPSPQLTLLDWALVRLLSVTPLVAVAGSKRDHTAIAAQYSASLNNEPVAVLADPVEGMGPMAGLVAALDWAVDRGSEWLLTLPVDGAVIPAGCLRGLASAAQNHPSLAKPCYLVSGIEQQYLCSVWPVAETRVAARLALGRGALAIHQLHRELGSDRIDVGELGYSEGIARVALMNANTPEEHEEMKSKVVQWAEELARM